MAKAKRGKSGSSTETARWETELIQASFNDVSLMFLFFSFCCYINTLIN